MRLLNKGKEKFLLHYNFPPFSTGEAKASRGVGRREVGHGNLAHRALKRMLPDNYPYTVRVVSDILESNGSSSMATVCAGTLALMDAGIPIKKPVTGIAMGLITDNEKYAVLSDILGDEDHLGDMDFKVTGTVDGITATQMDIKVDGLPYEILEKALDQARRGRLHIMNIINETLPEPRPDLKPHAPRMVTLTVDNDQIWERSLAPEERLFRIFRRNPERLSLLKKWVIRVSWILLPPMRNLSRLPLPASRLLLASLKSERFTREL